MNRVRTPCSASSGSSFSIVSARIVIRASISSLERDQFSVEKAKTASERTLSSRQVSTVRLSARVPARWPEATGRPWRLAQRPFPSMMMAIERADAGSSLSLTSESVRNARSLVRSPSILKTPSGQTSMISASLTLSSSSIVLMCSSVTF